MLSIISRFGNKGSILRHVRHYGDENSFATKERAKFMLSINEVIRNLSRDEKYSKLATDRWIDRTTWTNYLNSYRRLIIKDPLEATGSIDKFTELKNELDVFISDPQSEASIARANDYLFNMVIPRAEKDLQEIVAAHKTLESSTDLRQPHEWYPHARLMKRNIIYHGGPTNSGKVTIYAYYICYIC